MNKISYIRIGLWTIVGIAVAYAGLAYLKGSTLFSSTDKYYALFDQVDGVSIASPIIINGYRVGKVSKLSFDYESSQRTIIKMSLDKQVKIPTNATMTIESNPLTGAELFINIPAEHALTYYHSGDTIQWGGGSKRLFDQVKEEILPNVDSLLIALNATVNTVQTLVSDEHLSESIKELHRASVHINTILSQADKTVQDLPQLMNKINGIMGQTSRFTEQLDSVQLQDITANIEQTTRELSQFTKQLNNPNSSLSQLLNDKQLYLQVDSLIQSADALINDVKAHPKKYINLSVF